MRFRSFVILLFFSMIFLIIGCNSDISNSHEIETAQSKEEEIIQEEETNIEVNNNRVNMHIDSQDVIIYFMFDVSKSVNDYSKTGAIKTINTINNLIGDLVFLNNRSVFDEKYNLAVGVGRFSESLESEVDISNISDISSCYEGISEQLSNMPEKLNGPNTYIGENLDRVIQKISEYELNHENITFEKKIIVIITDGMESIEEVDEKILALDEQPGYDVLFGIYPSSFQLEKIVESTSELSDDIVLPEDYNNWPLIIFSKIWPSEMNNYFGWTSYDNYEINLNDCLINRYFTNPPEKSNDVLIQYGNEKFYNQEFINLPNPSGAKNFEIVSMTNMGFYVIESYLPTYSIVPEARRVTINGIDENIIHIPISITSDDRFVKSVGIENYKNCFYTAAESMIAETITEEGNNNSLRYDIQIEIPSNYCAENYQPEIIFMVNDYGEINRISPSIDLIYTPGVLSEPVVEYKPNGKEEYRSVYQMGLEVFSNGTTPDVYLLRDSSDEAATNDSSNSLIFGSYFVENNYGYQPINTNWKLGDSNKNKAIDYPAEITFIDHEYECQKMMSVSVFEDLLVKNGKSNPYTKILLVWNSGENQEEIGITCEIQLSDSIQESGSLICEETVELIPEGEKDE